MAGREGRRSILAQMAAQPASPAAAALSPTRALRIALSRAAELAAGLDITALGAADEEAPLADLLARVGDDWLLLRLDGPTGPGLAALDLPLLLAVVEARTRGSLAPQEPEHRNPTAADAALAEPLVTAFLSELPALTIGTALEGWPGDCALGPPLADIRALGLVLPETDFRMVSLSCWLGAGERQGAFLVALPAEMPPDPQDERVQRASQWAQALSQSVLDAELPLDTVLHRLRLSVAAVSELAPDRVLALPGVRVTGARLETADGRCIGTGRLGQSAGMRALRLEPPAAAELTPETEPPSGSEHGLPKAVTAEIPQVTLDSPDMS